MTDLLPSEVDEYRATLRAIRTVHRCVGCGMCYMLCDTVGDVHACAFGDRDHINYETEPSEYHTKIELSAAVLRVLLDAGVFAHPRALETRVIEWVYENTNDRLPVKGVLHRQIKSNK